MAYSVSSKKLKQLVDYYSPHNHGEELQCLSALKGEEGVLRYLQTSAFQGIDSTSIEDRIAWFGSNDHINQANKPTLVKILGAPLEYLSMKFYAFFSIMLLFLGIFTNYNNLSLPVLEPIVNSVGFLVTYLFLLVPQIYQHLDNEIIRQHSKEIHKCQVWRDNQRIELWSTDLVVGDIVEMQAGSVIGADGMIIEGQVDVEQKVGTKLSIAHKALSRVCDRKMKKKRKTNKNEESMKTLKTFKTFKTQAIQDKWSPIIIGGSKVIEGQGRMAVLCVGKNSRVGLLASLVHKAATQRKSKQEQKIASILFDITKYIIIFLILQVLLFIAKLVVFIFLKYDKKLQLINWPKTAIDFCTVLSSFLVGVPIYCVIGLAFGSIAIKNKMYTKHQLQLKYAKDCAKMKDIETISYNCVEKHTKINLVKWWNMNDQMIGNGDKQEDYDLKGISPRYVQEFVLGLRAENILPQAVGLKAPHFFPFIGEREISSIHIALNDLADQYVGILSLGMEDQEAKEDNAKSDSRGQDSSSNLHEDSLSDSEVRQKVRIKGSAETIIHDCTHIMDPVTSQIEYITPQIRQQMSKKIWKENANDRNSLATAYIQVNPRYPNFREKDSKMVFIAFVHYERNHNQRQFQALTAMRKGGINIVLVNSEDDHESTVCFAKQMGIIVPNKPSVQLKGYDLNKIVSGMICQACKKSICVCQGPADPPLRLKNQDQFSRLQKHLHVISEASQIDKLAFVIGATNGNHQSCMMGFNMGDVPAMRAASTAVTVKDNIADRLTKAAAEVTVPNDSLQNFCSLIHWSIFSTDFFRKYLTFVIPPCIVAFVLAFLTSIVSNQLVVSVLHCTWVTLLICPLLGFTFALYPESSSAYTSEFSRKNEQPEQSFLLQKQNYRFISSQVILQTLILILVVFLGHNFIPEQHDSIDELLQPNDWQGKYSTSARSTVCWGLNENLFTMGGNAYNQVYDRYAIHSRHLTFVFNLFVLMQIFNFFNCRKVNESSLNLLESISILQIVIVLLAVGLQVLLLMKGDKFWGLYPGGLTFVQWVICLGLASPVIIIGLLMKQIPQEDERQENKGRIWANRSYNLAVMSVAPRETLIDFEIEEDYEMRKLHRLAN